MKTFLQKVKYAIKYQLDTKAYPMISGGATGSSSVIDMVILIFIGLILFGIVIDYVTGQTTTSWGSSNVTLAYILPTLLLVGVVVFVLRKFLGGKH